MNIFDKKIAIPKIMYLYGPVATYSMHHSKNTLYSKIEKDLPEYLLKFAYTLSSDDTFIISPIVYSQRISENLSKDEFIKILKHKDWTYKEPGFFREVLFKIRDMVPRAINQLARANHPYLKLVIKFVDGGMLKAAINSIPDRRSEILIDRALNSKNAKLRAFGATKCHVEKLRGLIKDPSYSVRREVIKRLGLYNIAEEFLDDKDFWIRSDAALYLQRKDILVELLKEAVEEFDCIKQKLDAPGPNNLEFPWRLEGQISRIIEVLDKKDIIYFLDAKDFSSQINRIIQDKLSLQS